MKNNKKGKKKQSYFDKSALFTKRQKQIWLFAYFNSSGVSAVA